MFYLLCCQKAKQSRIFSFVDFAESKTQKLISGADIINIIRSKRLQTHISCKASIYAIIPLNNKAIVLSYNLLHYVNIDLVNINLVKTFHKFKMIREFVKRRNIN